MVFSTPVFLFLFMPVSVLLCGLARLGKGTGLRNAVLLALSLLFYAWGEPVYVLLMAGEVLINYAAALAVRRSRAVFILTIALDIGILVVFKYLDMFTGLVNGLFGSHLTLPGIALPVGISFYTFQILSYVIDVRRGSVKADRDLVGLACYITMFPQLIAGPIVRYSDIHEQLHSDSRDAALAADGALRFCRGLAKKVLLADRLGEIVDAVFAVGAVNGVGGAWIGLYAYALQILLDFSGYSDMAIGLGGLLGFRFSENFDMPYRSLSVREFWRRWHISLSSWFRDYVYIPLGGNRRGSARTLLNLLIVFALCGLWHGANVTFLLWGLWHGLFLCLERLGPVRRALDRLPGILRWLYTFAVVMAGWLLFRAESLPHMVTLVSQLFSSAPTDLSSLLSLPRIVVLGIGTLVSFLRLPRLPEKLRILSAVFSFALLALCAIALAGGTFDPFIYFRF